MNDINRKRNAEIEIKKGLDAWKAARNLFEDGLFGDCISRAYYAAFHFTQAALFILGLEAKSHQGLLKLFDQHFIKTRIFAAELSKVLHRAKKLREESDSRHTFVFTKEATKEELEEVESFIHQLQKYLKESGNF